MMDAAVKSRTEMLRDDREHTPAAKGERILMCAPDHFGVDYVINPWMENHVGRADRALAQEQWSNLRRHLSASADVAFVPAAAGLPDMVFTANAGLVVGDTVVVSRFRARERQPEEQLFKDWFEARGFRVAPWPGDVRFEGAGDALLDRAQPLIWCGYGWRTSEEAPKLLQDAFERETVALRLVDPRFYHLDTCFCPLAGGALLYYPPAFDEASQATIEALVPKEKRIAAADRDALSFACNAVEVNGRVFMNDASDELKNELADAGFTPVITPLSEFFKAGGAAKCLTLKLAED